MCTELLAEPWRYEFFQAIRLLSRWLRRYGDAPETAIRYVNSLSLAFPASDIDALQLEQGQEPGGANPVRLRVRTAVMGLLGLNGALPLHYTERIAAWEHATRDEGPRAFYDAFSSRQVALFYRAWRKYRVRGGADEHNRDRFLAQLVALAGAQGQPGAGLAFESLAYFAAQLRSRVVPAHLIAGVLAEYLQKTTATSASARPSASACRGRSWASASRWGRCRRACSNASCRARAGPGRWRRCSTVSRSTCLTASCR